MWLYIKQMHVLVIQELLIWLVKFLHWENFLGKSGGHLDEHHMIPIETLQETCVARYT